MGMHFLKSGDILPICFGEDVFFYTKKFEKPQNAGYILIFHSLTMIISYEFSVLNHTFEKQFQLCLWNIYLFLGNVSITLWVVSFGEKRVKNTYLATSLCQAFSNTLFYLILRALAMRDVGIHFSSIKEMSKLRDGSNAFFSCSPCLDSSLSSSLSHLDRTVNSDTRRLSCLTVSSVCTEDWCPSLPLGEAEAECLPPWLRSEA